jgi:hypothetical protein
MLQHKDAAMLDLALHRGLLSGHHYGRSLLRPASVMRKPKNPYWCPVRALVWRLGFSLALYDALNDP